MKVVKLGQFKNLKTGFMSNIARHNKGIEGIKITSQKLALMGQNAIRRTELVYNSTKDCDDSGYHGPNCASPDFCF